MATVTKWSGVAIAMQSALATADTITAITQANPGVATSSSHGNANGTYLKLEVSGMYQLDGKVVRVANTATNTFELEGINTTSYGTFSSGTAEAITFGTTLATVTGLTASGGDFDFIDTTTVHDTVRTQVPGLASALTFTFENIWDVSDAALVAMKAASDAQAERCFKFTFANGQIMVFNGYVGASLVPVGNAQDLVRTTVTITAFGTPTYYAS
jgi:hypothetical protein